MHASLRSPAALGSCLGLGLGLLFATPAAVQAQAQVFPAKPVTLVCPFAPGGTSDLIARTVAKSMSEPLGGQVIVVNRTGGGGTIGIAAAAKAAPDGYSLVMGGLGSVVLTAGVYGRKLPYNPQTDLAVVAAIANAPTVIAVRKTLPANSLQELIALARKQPGKLTFGTPGLGSSLHIAGEIFGKVTGTTLVHVPYKGGVPALTDLAGGQIDIAFTDVTLVQPFLQGDKVKPLAIAGANTTPFVPGAPSTRALGMGEIAMDTWYALFATGGTPGPVLERLRTAANSGNKSEEVQQALRNQGLTSLAVSAQEFERQLAADYTRWIPLVEDICKGGCE